MKNFKQTMLAGVMATLVCGVAMAGEVGNMTTFTSGSPAQASQVNGNFSALTTAVNDNNSRIEALEAALGVNTNVSGRYYKLRDMGWIFAAHRVGNGQSFPTSQENVENGFARVGFYVGNIDLHFEANGNFTLQGSDFDVEMFVNLESNIGSESNNANGSGTWVQQDNTLTMTFLDGNQEVEDVLEFTVSKGGLVLTANHGQFREAVQENFDPTIYLHEYDGGMIIAVEVDAPQP